MVTGPPYINEVDKSQDKNNRKIVHPISRLETTYYLFNASQLTYPLQLYINSRPNLSYQQGLDGGSPTSEPGNIMQPIDIKGRIKKIQIVPFAVGDFIGVANSEWSELHPAKQIVAIADNGFATTNFFNIDNYPFRLDFDVSQQFLQLYFGSINQFSGVSMAWYMPASVQPTVVPWEYWNGVAWAPIGGGVTGYPLGNTPELLGTNGLVYWGVPVDWALLAGGFGGPATVGDFTIEPLYYVRARITTEGLIPPTPQLQHVMIGNELGTGDYQLSGFLPGNYYDIEIFDNSGDDVLNGAGINLSNFEATSIEMDKLVNSPLYAKLNTSSPLLMPNSFSQLMTIILHMSN